MRERILFSEVLIVTWKHLKWKKISRIGMKIYVGYVAKLENLFVSSQIIEILNEHLILFMGSAAGRQGGGGRPQILEEIWIFLIIVIMNLTLLPIPPPPPDFRVQRTPCYSCYAIDQHLSAEDCYFRLYHVKLTDCSALYRSTTGNNWDAFVPAISTLGSSAMPSSSKERRLLVGSKSESTSSASDNFVLNKIRVLRIINVS